MLQRDAHAWPEVFFPGYGWVEFEPTTAQPPLDRVEVVVPSEGEQGGPDESGPGLEEDMRDLRRLLGGRVGGEFEEAPEIPISRPSPMPWIIAGAGLLLVGMLWWRLDPVARLATRGIVSRSLSRMGVRPPARWTGYDLAPITPIARVYWRWSAGLQRIGLPVHPSQTPFERGRAFADEYPLEAEQRLGHRARVRRRALRRTHRPIRLRSSRPGATSGRGWPYCGSRRRPPRPCGAGLHCSALAPHRDPDTFHPAAAHRHIRRPSACLLPEQPAPPFSAHSRNWRRRTALPAGRSQYAAWSARHLGPSMRHVRVSPLGSLYAERPSVRGARLLLTASLDETGFIVSHVDRAGIAWVQPHGRIDADLSSGAPIRFQRGTRATLGVIPSRARQRGPTAHAGRLRCRRSRRHDRGSGPWACSTRRGRDERTLLSCKAIDGRLGAAIALEVVQRTSRAPNTLLLALTTLGQVHHRSLTAAATELAPAGAVDAGGVSGPTDARARLPPMSALERDR